MDMSMYARREPAEDMTKRFRLLLDCCLRGMFCPACRGGAKSKKLHREDLTRREAQTFADRWPGRNPVIEEQEAT